MTAKTKTRPSEEVQREVIRQTEHVHRWKLEKKDTLRKLNAIAKTKRRFSVWIQILIKTTAKSKSLKSLQTHRLRYNNASRPI